MDFNQIEQNFKSKVLSCEDDVKIHFYAEIVKPILNVVNPLMANAYKSENVLLAGGRTDATFQNISFEFKENSCFDKESGVEEALYGRKYTKDHGLYDYIISNSGITNQDTEKDILVKLKSGIGVGFDGKSFLFARFIPSISKQTLDTKKIKIKLPEKLNLSFYFEKKDMSSGIKRLALLLKQRDKMALNKMNVLSIINAKSSFVRDSIINTYNELLFNLYNEEGSNRVRTLYKEWDKVFGIMYGEDAKATDFTEVSSKIRALYGIKNNIDIDSKLYLFAMQTFFNIFLKLMVYSFLSQLIDPSFTCKQELSKAEIDKLFDGSDKTGTKIVNNFFEAHFLEWFTYTCSGFEEKIVNNTLAIIDKFDLGTYVLKPENVQDILQEVYMELIPDKMRHLMGEYFSPDWIVEHVLDMVGYDGDISKKIIDPCAGSGPFLTQTIKRIIQRKNGNLTQEDILNITNNVVGFDINPISVVAAKANYILIMFSAFFDNINSFEEPISIPVFIADSILSPIVYAEENEKVLKLKTSVGNFELPKFETYAKGNEFLTLLSSFIHEKADLENFISCVLGKHLISEDDIKVVKTLFEKLYVLHRSGKDSFWPIILRNSFAPIMIADKFDFVVGNPPWIAWKSMSHSYRAGTLSIWKSYGIFEKNAYDKKTTHDDFGMAVTYVAIDQYLKDNGKMVFLLPASFLKSTKGGEGFRKLKIIRKGQNVPFSIDCVHDFSNVNLFTVPTVAILFEKNKNMSYPMKKYVVYNQIGKKNKIDSHWSWSDVSVMLEHENLIAQPVAPKELQSAWLTLKNMDFANNVLDVSKPRFYKGRKGIEPAGAKGVFILKKPKKLSSGYLKIENDISRQRREDIRKKGSHTGIVEETYIYPMLGGRNISKWTVKSNEFILVPHDENFKYGIPENKLAQDAPNTFLWLRYYQNELLETRIQNGKFFNPQLHPFYRLDNVGTYTYAPYKVLWKEQTSSMAAVVVSSYNKSIPDADLSLFTNDKIIVVDSKVLMLGLYDEMEAYFVCGIINSRNIIEVIDGYAIHTNRGVDVLKYIAIPKYDSSDQLHKKIASLSKDIHKKSRDKSNYKYLEEELNNNVYSLFEKKV